MRPSLLAVLGLLAVTSALPMTSLRQNYAEYSADLVRRINAMNTTWKAGPNFARETVHSVLGRLGNPFGPPPGKKPGVPVLVHDEASDIPDEFDAREKWPQCPSIGRIAAMGRCHAYWAFAAVEAITDRYCIYHGVHVNISADDAMTCYDLPVAGNGCGGGYTGAAWFHWKQAGLVTGGSYDSKSGCRPYPFPPCNHFEKGTYGPCPKAPDATHCNKTCRAGYPKAYDQDKHYGSVVYEVDNSEESIQREIMANGSVAVDIVMYQDFPIYRSGVYRHTSDTKIGDHSLKILGWGVEGDQKYWLCANFWNSEWGEKGFIKVLRGVNECSIEQGVFAGIPEKPQ